ncbi:hypothetical protein FXB39_12060 [Nocardioides sp. BGMRC 2183]|nr:hypothetical protein FXB39_12060 [Nocardioides sp. BGMRC 2183]
MRLLPSALATGAATALTLLLTTLPTTAVADDAGTTDTGGLDLPGLPTLPHVPGLPIPSLPTDLLVPDFQGSAVTPRRLPAPPVPQNPYLAPNGASSMHNDPYSTDAYDVSGPVGNDLEVTSASYGIRECATIAFDSHDRMVGLCGGIEGFTMMVIDPDTLKAIDELQLSSRDLLSGKNPLTDICGGTYFFLDQRDRAYATTVAGGIAEVKVADDGALSKGRSWDLTRHMPEDDCLVATTVDWSGRLWWFTQQGVVGTLDRATGKVRTHRLPAGEGVFNSVSGDETDGIYVVTTHALYRLDADRGDRPAVTWRQRYDRGGTTKPGMLSQGSGTTPTLIGKRWVVIADNAEPRTRIVAFDRRRGVQHRRHCTVPVLGRNAGTTENSLVAAGRSVIIENNYGYSGIGATLFGRSTTPGIARVMIGKKCRVAWTNDAVAPTSVPKASLGNGLVYAYTKPARKDGIDAWYLTAIDIRTGKSAWSKLTGTGIQWNNHYASIYLGPDGAAYLATIAGLIRVVDAR